MDCVPVWVADEYVCQRCGWGKGKALSQPFRRSCPRQAAEHADWDDEVRTIYGAHKPKCKGRKVSRQELFTRLEHCQPCHRREEITCLESGLLIAVQAGWRSHCCLLGKWKRIP